MLERLEPLARRIRESREALSENAAEVRKLDNGAPMAGFGERLIVQVAKGAPDFTVCAVDGGLLADRFVGSDILVRRAVAARFVYEAGKLAETSYYPKKFPENEADFRYGLDEHDALVFRSLYRLSGEIGVAVEAAERFRPDYLLLDGSVVLLGSDRPADDSPLRKDYDALVSSYRALYEKCDSLGCQLVGVIKDSRGGRLSEMLRDKLIVDAPDALLADALLKEGERTSVMAYSADAQKHQVLKGLGPWGAKVKLFYLKPSASDMPLRVEFMQGAKSQDEIASAILSLSSISRAYAYPAALIEADMCAALPPLEMEKIKRSLAVMSGGAAKPLRRAERPFR